MYVNPKALGLGLADLSREPSAKDCEDYLRRKVEEDEDIASGKWLEDRLEEIREFEESSRKAVPRNISRKAA